MANYDVLGNIAIIKFQKSEKLNKIEKIKKARELMGQYKSLKTVLEKTEKVSGRLRTIKTKYLFGERNLIAEYKENGCFFKFNVETCYFSPRLAHERQDISQIIKKEMQKNKKLKQNAQVLVMFAGVSPFSIAIAKIAKPKKILSIELGKECNFYAQKNININKVYDKIELIQGDVKKKVKKIKEKQDFIVMPRPNLKENFLKEAFSVSKKGTKIFYYGFSSEKNLQKMLSEIHKQAKKHKKAIKIQNVKEAGDIAPFEHRYRVDILVC